METLNIEFIISDIDRFRNFQNFFYELKDSKKDGEGVPDAESPLWLEYLDDNLQAFFHSDKNEEGWDFISLIDSIHTAEYNLVSCEVIEGSKAEIIYTKSYYGIEVLIVLLESWGFEIIKLPFDLK